MKALTERVAVVTGGARGVGVGIATVLAAEGARVAIADLDLEAAERVVADLGRRGHEAVAVETDVVSRASTDAMAEVVTERFGRIDILAANAGIYPEARLQETEDSLIDRILAVNVKGALHSFQSCLPAMQSQGYGRMVLTSSITGNLVAAQGFTNYGASKAAMLGLMRGAALEFVGDGITVNAVLPGNVRSAGFEALDDAYKQQILRAIPMARLAEPEEVGWAVRFLASEEAAYVTGQTLVLDGGQVLPEGDP